MTKGEVKRAEAYAIVNLQEWLECTGAIPLHTGYHSEVESIVIDAVHIGIQMALSGKVNFDDYGNIKCEE